VRAGTVEVQRVRHRTAAADPLVGRLRLASVLERADVGPRGLAPSAILCVRRLGDPLPRRLRVRPGEVRPPPEWERAAAEALGEALRQAARPALEAVPASANAVLFADRGELLACLAADWLSGDFAARWWWPGIVGSAAARPAAAPRLARAGDGVRTSVLEAWFAAPQHVAAALELLAARGQAVAFVESLVAEEAGALAAVVATAAALPALAAAAGEAAGPDRPPAVAAPPAGPAPAPPWHGLAPEAAMVRRTPARELLLGLALALRRAPAAVRTPAFAAATRAWLGAPAGESARASPPAEKLPARPDRTASEPDVPAPPRPTRPRSRGRRRDEPPPAAARAVARDAPSRTPESQPPPAPPFAGAATRAAAGPSPAAPARAEEVDAFPVAAARAPRAGAEQATPSASRPPAFEQPSAPQAPAPEVAGAGELAEATDTELGGLFFLVSLALHLGLVADFSAPEGGLVGLDPWDLVALLGPRLLDDPSPADPVWPLLARLAGRNPRERPARDFAPPDDWRVPPRWLEPWPETGDWTWSAARGRLRIRHPAGFFVVDVAGGASALDAELAPYSGLAGGVRRARLPADGARGRPATRWAHRLARYARPRLARALGTDDLELFLRRPARILVTPAHVDVVFALAHHPLEIRLAGLDRDPGWIPAAGRFLAFRFE
jgi:hypothetical protein